MDNSCAISVGPSKAVCQAILVNYAPGSSTNPPMVIFKCYMHIKGYILPFRNIYQQSKCRSKTIL